MVLEGRGKIPGQLTELALQIPLPMIFACKRSEGPGREPGVCSTQVRLEREQEGLQDVNLSWQEGPFPMSQFISSGGHSIGASASASILLMNIQG